MSEPIVIVGAGQAGIKAAETLRLKSYESDILLIGEEKWPPYQRPPLSKAYLKGELSEDRLLLKAADYYDKARVALFRLCRSFLCLKRLTICGMLRQFSRNFSQMTFTSSTSQKRTSGFKL